MYMNRDARIVYLRKMIRSAQMCGDHEMAESYKEQLATLEKQK